MWNRRCGCSRCWRSRRRRRRSSRRSNRRSFSRRRIIHPTQIQPTQPRKCGLRQRRLALLVLLVLLLLLPLLRLLLRPLHGSPTLIIFPPLNVLRCRRVHVRMCARSVIPRKRRIRRRRIIHRKRARSRDLRWCWVCFLRRR